MIKTRVVEAKKLKEVPEYPQLKIDSDHKFVVLFTGPEEGVVVYDPEDIHGVGSNTYDDDDASWAERHFEPFYGTIELSNA